MSQKSEFTEETSSPHHRGRGCLPLTSEVLSRLQVILSSLELLQGGTPYTVPTIRRMSTALDSLLDAIASERGRCEANEVSHPVGHDSPR